MSVASFRAYPVPASKGRAIKDTYAKVLMPSGKPYARGKHGGIDVPPSQPGLQIDAVVATNDGRVVGIRVWGSSYGNSVLVKHTHKHADGTRHYWYTFYAHLRRIDVSLNQVVKAGQSLGRVGASGNTFGPHVHFELHTKPEWRLGLLNPFSRLEAARTR